MSLKKVKRDECIVFADLPPNPLSVSEIRKYKKLGFTAFVLTEDDVKFTVGGKITEEYKTAIKNVSDSGLDVIIRNMYNDEDYFDNPEPKKSSNYGSEYEIEKRSVTDEFSAFPRVVGFYAADEPYMRTLKEMPWRWAHKDKEKFASFDKLVKIAEWKNKYYPEAFFHVNHVPSESYDHYFPSGNEIYDYADFLTAYADKVLRKLDGGGRSLCLDSYPFVGEGYMESSYLKDLFTGATVTKKYNDSVSKENFATFGICIQAFHAHSMKAENEPRHRDIYSAAEITLQLYAGAALGAKLFEFFCYRSFCGRMEGIMRTDGTERIYDIVKKANDSALPLIKKVCKFSWTGGYCVGGSVFCDNARAIIDAKSSFERDEKIEVFSEYDLIVGRFKKGKKSGYMFVNYTDPSKNVKNKIRINGRFSKISVISDFGKKANFETDGRFETELSTGGGIFVVIETGL